MGVSVVANENRRVDGAGQSVNDMAGGEPDRQEGTGMS